VVRAPAGLLEERAVETACGSGAPQIRRKTTRAVGQKCSPQRAFESRPAAGRARAADDVRAHGPEVSATSSARLLHVPITGGILRPRDAVGTHHETRLGWRGVAPAPGDHR
jgi:hypothetical protein